MESLPHAKGVRDLLAYQKARRLALEIFRLTASFPKEEMYSLTDQIRRSSRAIGANIAEAWAKRRYERHFISKLTDADGEQQETQHWVEAAADCGYLNTEAATALRNQCEEIGLLLGGMISKASSFCGEPARTQRESPAEYYVTASPATDD